MVDPARDPGARVVSAELTAGGPVDPAASYTLACTAFIANGHDGYDVLAACPRVVDLEQGTVAAARSPLLWPHASNAPARAPRPLARLLTASPTAPAGSLVTVVVQVAFTAVRILEAWRARHKFVCKAINAMKGARDSARGDCVVTAPVVDGRIAFVEPAAPQ